ncbi:hypothetical protein VitviT2T_026876 [Vitis vinifera]|uniref:Integrase catalytic domain-containing protein n=1 Tax=Vitis vinifera TaxID=29760 RepID=A0ABY9DQ43_VITVI|nr:hypothetical protein VitviT2T_026876 [Vitis vinifera]
MMEPIPPLTKERQRTINNGISPLSDSIVLSESNLTSANANTGNFASKGKRQRPQCTHCGLQGHSIHKCYKLHGYPPGYKPKLHNALGHAHTNQASILSNDSTPSESMLGNLSSTQCQQLIALLSSQLQCNSTALMESQPQESPSVSCFSGKVILSSSISHIPISSYSWVLDTGATHHVCCSLILFKTSSLSHNSTVSLPNGHSVVVTRVGSVELFDRFIIENLLYVPQFHFNLLSVNALTQYHHCSVHFVFESCFIQDRMQRKMIGMGRCSGNLYVLDPTNLFPISSSVTVVCNYASKTEHELWHYRLCHLSYNRLNSLKDVLNLKQFVSHHFHCSICHLAKQKSLSFPISNTVSSSLFELLHLEIWGSFHYPTHEGFRYFFTIVDVFSRSTWIYLLHAKSDVLDVFPAFYNLVHTQFGIKIKYVHSDNTPKLSFSNFFRENEILSFHSCVDTPQQNSVVERKHQHLLNVVRALLFQSNVPLGYWGDCVLAATYLINRTPTLILSNKTPFEVLYNKLPSYTHLGAFGCLCYGSSLT